MTSGFHVGVYTVEYYDDRVVFTRLCRCKEVYDCDCPCHEALLAIRRNIEEFRRTDKVMSLHIRTMNIGSGTRSAQECLDDIYGLLKEALYGNTHRMGEYPAHKWRAGH